MAMKRNLKFGRGGQLLDEDKMKQRGLDASNKEGGVGLLQRLKMGNIDDPKSEAYKKFGAGRGRKARDDADFAAEEARGKTARAVAGTPAKKAPAKKAPIVTKEQLEKSGFTNLRDYMNAQRGLTRRDGKAPVMRDSAAAKTSKTARAVAGRPKQTATEKAKAFTAAMAQKKRDDADFAAEDARSKTARAVAGRPALSAATPSVSNSRGNRTEGSNTMPARGARPSPTKARAANIAATRKDADTAGTKRFVKDVVRGSEKTSERKRMQDDIDTAAAKRKVSGFAKGGGIEIRGKTNCKMR